MHASICGSGIQYRRLGLPEEDRFLGAGVYYGAGASEAQFCAGDEVYVVGGGNSAGQAVMHFSRDARSVVMVIRGDGLKETLSQYLIDRVFRRPRKSADRAVARSAGHCSRKFLRGWQSEKANGFWCALWECKHPARQSTVTAMNNPNIKHSAFKN